MLSGSGLAESAIDLFATRVVAGSSLLTGVTPPDHGRAWLLDLNGTAWTVVQSSRALVPAPNDDFPRAP